MRRLLAAAWLAGCGGPDPCPGTDDVTKEMHAIRPPLDEDGKTCTSSDTVMTTRHVGPDAFGIHDRYRRHYGNHGWEVHDLPATEGYALSMRRLADGLTAEVQIVPRDGAIWTTLTVR